MSSTREVPLLLRLLWFFFVGLPVGWAATLIAWCASVTIIGLPLGIWILNRLPQIMTLKQPELQVKAIPRGGFYHVTQQSPDQLPLIIRLLWFLAAGWWLSGVWMTLAFALSASIIGIPFAFWMFNRVPRVLFLTE
ncbi:MAG: YccF domain-containing protein [Candidatus Wallbacteria bacterium]|nr:YccF domain-containing protein [Candidatus Wallbacteria bacterium]MBI4865532.1 YccF domain-containing protein [Candidatus Wallbacteria bacterium]